jgi:multidrug transporter EmrE-like cation transporter
MLSYAAGEYSSKRYAMTPSAWLYWQSVVCYSFGVFAWMPLIKQTNTLAITSTIWGCGCFVVSIVLAFAVFHERLTLTQIAGLVFAAVAIALLSIDS